MTPLPGIRKPVATRSALPSGVICKGASMPPYFNLLLVISSHPSSEPEIFVHITQQWDSGAITVLSVFPLQKGLFLLKKARTLGILGLFSAGW